MDDVCRNPDTPTIERQSRRIPTPADALAQRIQAAMIADCLARPYPCPCCIALNAMEETECGSM